MTTIIINVVLCVLFLGIAIALAVYLWKRASDLHEEIRNELANTINPRFKVDVTDDEIKEIMKRQHKGEDAK